MTDPGWCTNWDAYDLPRLWQMVSGEDNEEGWAQAQAWIRLRSAVDAQRQRLQACRQTLQEQWPPESSPASAAFIAYLDHLIASMTETARAAESTARGLSGIMNSLATAKAEMKPLYDEWQSASTDLTPRWWDHAEDELNAKARTIMAKTELAVADYTPMIEIPDEFRFQDEVDPGTPLGPPTSSGKKISAGPRGGVGLAGVSPAPVPPVPHVPPPPLPGVDPLLPGGGPVLSGAPAPVTVPPNAAAPGLPGGPGTGAPGGHAGLPGPPITGPLPGRGAAAGRSTLPGSRMAGPRGGTLATPMMPPGATPGRPATGPGGSRPPMVAPATGTNARTSGIPPGVVHPGGGHAYHSGGGHPAHTPGPARRSTGVNSERDTWSVDEGVTPVIAPVETRPHDPGPGIIGIDR